MAKKEKIYNNTKLEAALKRVSYNGLTSEATLIINQTIQECKSLGKYKLPVKDVFYIVRNATELSKAQVKHYLTITRSDQMKKFAASESSIEKYKSACTAVAKALDKYVEDGGTLCGLKKALPDKSLTDEQKNAVQELLDSKASAKALIAYLQKIA
ncbi:TPA: hypothetical protein P1459_002965 [Salmonella enterica subsp. enterica serovar Aberdeen]|nr:hypothetical protein [Salmonella enterica]HDN5862964.1 hypothetical protein [Salmonella enterica subsp. enterica serovar Aberdeen]